MSYGSPVAKKLKKAGDLIDITASTDRKEKAHAAVALLSISNQVGPSWAAKLIKLFDDIFPAKRSITGIRNTVEWRYITT